MPLHQPKSQGVNPFDTSQYIEVLSPPLYLKKNHMDKLLHSTENCGT